MIMGKNSCCTNVLIGSDLSNLLINYPRRIYTCDQSSGKAMLRSRRWLRVITTGCGGDSELSRLVLLIFEFCVLDDVSSSTGALSRASCLLLDALSSSDEFTFDSETFEVSHESSDPKLAYEVIGLAEASKPSAPAFNPTATPTKSKGKPAAKPSSPKPPSPKRPGPIRPGLVIPRPTKK